VMKAAFAYWDDRVSPVFDISRQIHIVEVAAGQIVWEAREILPDGLPVQKVLRLAELGVGTLVCGAISKHLRELAEAYGIQVISFVGGDLREIIQAWQNNALEGDAFAMPGCRGQGRRPDSKDVQHRWDHRGPGEE
jgi:predicted Fe-Mo cluster-binding NifX family protein